MTSKRFIQVITQSLAEWPYTLYTEEKLTALIPHLNFCPLRSDSSLAGSCDAWGLAGGGGVAVAIELLCIDLAIGEGGDIRNLGVLERTSCLSAGWSLSVLLVCCEIEGDEEKQVGTEDTHARESSELLTCALAMVWHIWEVGGGEVGV